LSDKTPIDIKSWIREQWGASKLPPGGVVPAPATSLEYKTGEWREFKPILDDEKCTGCTQCYFICPDDAIKMDDRFHPIFDYDFCKGCTLCVEICPVDAIKIVKEVK